MSSISIHIDQLPMLKAYFKDTGWTCLKPRHPSEALRVCRRDHRRPVVVHFQHQSPYLATASRDSKIFQKFVTHNTSDNCKGELQMTDLEKKVTLLVDWVLSVHARERGAIEKELRKLCEPLCRESLACESSSLDAEARIQEILMHLGFRSSLKGYQYIIDAVRILLEEPTLKGHLISGVYPTVASMYDGNPVAVNRDINYALTSTWSRARLPLWQHYFGDTVYLTQGKPSASHFLYQVARCVERSMSNQKGGNANEVD